MVDFETMTDEELREMAEQSPYAIQAMRAFQVLAERGEPTE